MGLTARDPSFNLTINCLPIMLFFCFWQVGETTHGENAKIPNHECSSQSSAFEKKRALMDQCMLAA